MTTKTNQFSPLHESRVKRAAFFGGPVVALLVWLAMNVAEVAEPACSTAAIVVLCAVWWVFEPIPIPATALIPFAAFPLIGVLDHRTVANAYGHPMILLMIAGSMISTAMEKSGAHRRVALGMVRLVGGGGGRSLVLGFLLASAMLSMWISNTATTLMLLPVALAVLDSASGPTLRVPILLAVAYGAAAGGCGTPIGTPTNLLFMSVFSEATGTEITFFEWMKIGLPVVLLLLPIIWLWLTRHVRSSDKVDLPAAGRMRPSEWRVLALFGMTALAWMTRSAPLGGWSGLLGTTGIVGDSTVALAAVVAMFVLPSGDSPGERLLDWETASKIPWGVFVMIGGGIVIGQAFHASKLSELIGGLMTPLASWPILLVILTICFTATFLTELVSNAAMANLSMPILAAAAPTMGADPQLLMIPALLGLNLSFMLPVATASNAIVYGTGYVSTATMVREGLVLNLAGTAVITLTCFLMFS